MQDMIQEAVRAGIEAGKLLAIQTPTDTYEAVIRRLNALPVLYLKVADDERQLELLRSEKLPEHTAQLPSGKLAVLIRELEIALMLDRQEIETMEQALTVIQDDPYYPVISGRYLEGLSDREISVMIPCNAATVRKNRGRLVRRLAVRLYGVQAVNGIVRC